MRSKAIGPLATLLTIVSILAIPLLAIFGIPQFVPVVASPVFSPFESAIERAKDIRKTETIDYRSRDIFAPVQNYSPNAFQRRGAADNFGWAEPFGQELAVSASAANRPIGARPEHQFSVSDPMSQPLSSSGTSRAQRVSLPNDRRELSRDPQIRSEQPFTWRLAITRLNGFGIDQFRLQPGAQPGTFHFCCYLNPTDDSRVSIRFESEATEPLRAVKAVLDQVRQWDQMR